MSFFRPNLNDLLSEFEISRNDIELKYFDESDTKSIVFLEIYENFGKFEEISENFDGLFHFPIKIFVWSLLRSGGGAGRRGGRRGGAHRRGHGGGGRGRRGGGLRRRPRGGAEPVRDAF